MTVESEREWFQAVLYKAGRKASQRDSVIIRCQPETMMTSWLPGPPLAREPLNVSISVVNHTLGA